MADPLSVLRDRYAQPDAATQRYQALLDQMAQKDAVARAQPKGWSGVGAAMPEAYGANSPIYDPLASTLISAATLPKRAIDASRADVAHYAQSGFGGSDYTPQTIGPAAETAMLMAGGPASAEAGAGEMLLGAGRVRGTPPRGVLTKADFAPTAAPKIPERLQIGGNNPPAEFQYPQYASEYPPPGPPELKLDKKKQAAFLKGGMSPEEATTEAQYLGKLLTPEQKTFQKVRGQIGDDMETKGYVPFFDPAKRYDVDPANYPPNVDTMTITPAKQATIDKYMTGTPEKPGLGSDEVRSRLQGAYQRGSEMPNTRNWYMMGQLENEFVKELGPEAGRKAFQEKFAVPMAATTGGADPTANLLTAQYGNYLRANNLPLPEASHQYPFPVGGQYVGGNMAMYNKVMEQGGFPGLGAANPKRHNFSQNFTGNPNVATMDEQMTSGMTPGVNEPGQQYGLYEKVLREEAAKAGVSPREFQEVGWAGFKNMKDPSYTSGKPMIEHVNDAIERTHRLTGMPRDEIMKQAFIYSKIPLYALAGTLGAGAAGQFKDRQ